MVHRNSRLSAKKPHSGETLIGPGIARYLGHIPGLCKLAVFKAIDLNPLAGGLFSVRPMTAEPPACPDKITVNGCSVGGELPSISSTGFDFLSVAFRTNNSSTISSMPDVVRRHKFIHQIEATISPYFCAPQCHGLDVSGFNIVLRLLADVMLCSAVVGYRPGRDSLA